MEIEVEYVEELRFDDGSPVRAASGLAPFGAGFLVVQDDGTHAAWCEVGSVRAVRLLQPVDGLDTFDEPSGTKHLKPDLESSCAVGDGATLLLGSGSSPARMRWALVRLDGGVPRATAADLTPLYARVAHALSVELDLLNLEGACVVGDTLRWFQRGLPSAGAPTGSVDVVLADAVAAALGDLDPSSVTLAGTRTYELGTVHGLGLAVTDAVALPDGTLLLSAAAEDSPNPRDDGPVVGSALVHLDDETVLDVAPLPLVAGEVSKVEGLMVLESSAGEARVLAVADVDDHTRPSLALRLRLRF